jgi:hypothetical protein
MLDRRVMRWLIPVAALGLIACGLLGAATWQALPAVRHEAAVRRWQAAPLSHYRLATRERVASRTCTQEVEVVREQVVRIVSSTCRRATRWSVTAMFERIERGWNAAAECVPAGQGYGCACQTSFEQRAVYDAARGYPLSFSSVQTWRENWTSLDYWRYIWAQRQRPDCVYGGEEYNRIVNVTGLTPLP